MAKANNAPKDTPHTPHMPSEATPDVEKSGGDLNDRGEGVGEKNNSTDNTERSDSSSAGSVSDAERADKAITGTSIPPSPPTPAKRGTPKNKKDNLTYIKNKNGEVVTVRDKNKKGGRPKKADGRLDPRQMVLVDKIKKAITEQDPDKLKSLNMGKLMKESGYSVAYAANPHQIMNTNNFQILLEKHLPDDTIAKVHGDALKAEKLDHYVFPAGEKDSVIKDVVESVAGCKLVKIRKKLQWKRAYFTAPDTGNRIKAIQEAYKVKGRYPASKHEHFVAKVVVTNYAEQS